MYQTRVEEKRDVVPADADIEGSHTDGSLNLGVILPTAGNSRFISSLMRIIDGSFPLPNEANHDQDVSRAWTFARST